MDALQEAIERQGCLNSASVPFEKMDCGPGEFFIQNSKLKLLETYLQLSTGSDH